MLIIHGQFISKRDRDNSFCVLTDKGSFYTCYGMAPDLKKMMPVAVYGTLINNFFQTNTIEFDCSDRAKFVQFFSGRSFKGVSKVSAGKLYDKLHEVTVKYNIPSFQKLPRKTVSDIVESLHFQEITKKAVIEQFFSLSDRITIFEKLRVDGGSYKTACELYDLEGANAYEKVAEHPYNYISYIPFSVLDRVAFRHNVPAYDDQRVSGIIYAASQRIYRSGSSYTTMDGYLSFCHTIESCSEKYDKLPDALYLSALLATNIVSYSFDEKVLHIYPSHFMYVEKRIAKELSRLCIGQIPTGYQGNVVDDTLDDDQKAALSFLKTSGVKIITGGPGSGKTTLIKKMISEYMSISKDNLYYLTAPTGRAAVRISESSGYPASTIHKLLKFKPYTLGGETNFTTYNKENQFPKGLFLIDEMSMVGEELFLMMLEAIPTGSILILSGDPRQLPSVEAGNVLLDLIHSNEIPVQELTHIHRQKGESLIIENYLRIKNYDPDLETNDTFQIMYDNSLDNTGVIQKIRELKALYEKKDDPYAFQILSLTKKGTIGKNAINDVFVKENEEKNLTQIGKSSFYVGDKVMMNTNNYTYNYFNGDIGIITGVDEQRIYIEFFDGVKAIPKQCLPEIEHADATTVHKSQGSEYETVVIVIDDQYKNMLYNSIILTAVTRAKKRVFIISKRDALIRSIVSKNGNDRQTGLIYRMKEEL